MIEDQLRKSHFDKGRLESMLTVGLAIVALVTLGLVPACDYQRSTEVDRGLLLQSRAKRLAQRITIALSDNIERLNEIAEDSELRELLKNHDQVALATKAQELETRLNSVLKLRLLIPGTDVDYSSEPPLTYASLEMIQAAETTDQPIKAEVHLFGRPAQHIAIVKPIRSHDGQFLGAIHLSSKVDAINAALEGLEMKDGYLEVQQPLESGRPLVLAKRGATGRLQEIKPVRVPVPLTSWMVSYWSQEGERIADGSDTKTGNWFAVVGSLLLAGLIVATLVLMRRKLMPAGDEALGRPGTAKTDTKQAQAVQREEISDQGGEAVSGEETAASDTPMTEQPTGSPIIVEEIEGDMAFSSASVPPDSIFRAYDIRGIVGDTLTEDGIYQIGRALGSEAHARGQQSIVIGRDGRNSSPSFSQALAKGLTDSGQDVIDIGMVPTPVLYFASHYLDTGSGIMITGSHNPPEYNGLKIVLGGETLSGDAIIAIRNRIANDDVVDGNGSLQSTEIASEYIRRITEEIPVALGRAFKIVVDCGNGVAGTLAPQLFRALGHDVVELYCDVDGDFPNHHPDPSQPENLHPLIATVKAEDADLGLAFDGDGDRLGVVDNEGNIIWPDRQMMLFAQDILSRNPDAQIIFDVKCSDHLRRVIEQAGGKPLMWKTGHSLIKAKMKETGALLAGEMSGHIFFKERWYGFDDALYSAARLLEILVNDNHAPGEVFAALPGGIATPELRLDMAEEQHGPFMRQLIERVNFDDAEVHHIDGLRVDFTDGWGLIRPSNTTPCLILRFEADDDTALARIQSRFRDELLAIDRGLQLPF